MTNEFNFSGSISKYCVNVSDDVGDISEIRVTIFEHNLRSPKPRKRRQQKSKLLFRSHVDFLFRYRYQYEIPPQKVYTR